MTSLSCSFIRHASKTEKCFHSRKIKLSQFQGQIWNDPQFLSKILTMMTLSGTARTQEWNKLQATLYWFFFLVLKTYGIYLGFLRLVSCKSSQQIHLCLWKCIGILTARICNNKYRSVMKWTKCSLKHSFITHSDLQLIWSKLGYLKL